jgi:hypothetical protein
MIEANHVTVVWQEPRVTLPSGYAGINARAESPRTHAVFHLINSLRGNTEGKGTDLKKLHI